MSLNNRFNSNSCCPTLLSLKQYVAFPKFTLFRYSVAVLLLLASTAFNSLDAQLCSFDEAYTLGSQRAFGDYDGAPVVDPVLGIIYPNPGDASLSIGITTGLPAATTVTSPMVINLCFAGDIDTEFLRVNISGEVFFVGSLGYIPSTLNFEPYCRDFVIPASTVETDLSDGDIDITVSPFLSGGDWTTDPSSGFDDYGFDVITIDFDYDFNVDISPVGPADNPGTPQNESVLVRCDDGADIDFNSTFPGATFQINPIPPSGFNTATGFLDVSVIPPGQYNINANFTNTGNDCSVSSAIVQVEVLAGARTVLKPTLINCAMEGDSINLSVMFDGSNQDGGTYSVTSGPGATINGDFLLIPPGGGCFGIQYSVTDAACGGATRVSNVAELLIIMAPTPEFMVEGYSGPICNAGGTETITLTNVSNGPNQSLTIRSASGMVNGAPATMPVSVPFGSVSLSGPGTSGSHSYQVCLLEQNSAPTSCTSTFPVDDPMTAEDEGMISTCAEASCTNVVIFNDGNNCAPNAFFTSECEPDVDATDVCNVEEKNNLALSCSFFTLNGPQLIEAELTNFPGLVQCSDETITFDWQGSLPGDFGDIATGGPTLGDINPAAGVICDIITFEICIPLPIVDDICIDPIPLGPFEDACDQTIGQIIFTNLGTLIGGDGGSGLVVADTDGDGNFDYIVEDYTFPANGTSTIPNNITSNTGTITIRNVTSWPFKASDVCGDISTKSINLLELLPIGAIPLVGIIIEDLLAAASCNVDLVFTDAETVEIPVYNNTAPEFANCPENGYVITEDGICDTEANWSIPIVYDGCSGNPLQYKGFTDYPEATANYNGTATPTPVAVSSSGLYQTAGPLPGSDLDPGTYTIAYTAYSCAEIISTCIFDVLVTSGDPVLACPDDLLLKVDSDECSTVVTGIAPLQGLSCATVLNYSVAFSDGTSASTSTPYTLDNRGTHNIASGLEFPFGESTVTYTMETDINGDGTIETQTCDFTVTILDAQRPVASCIDVDVQLDNTGNVVVFAENPMDGATFLDGGSTDNCEIQSILVAKPGEMPAPSVMFDCTETGYNLVTLFVTDNSDNVTTCISQVKVDDFFEGITFDLDVPEICLEANNPSQLDFSNYLIITLPDGTTLSHEEVMNNTYLGDAVGGFGITAFAPADGSGSVNPGSISTDGIYTPGDGTGFVTVSYVLALPGAVVQNGNVALTGCLEITHATFELRQPLDMESPECECIVQNDRIVNLGEISGGLEPYTIQFSGVQLDVDNDQIADDVDGSFTYQGTFTGSAGGTTNYDNGDFVEDLGNLLVDYTQPTWSFTIVDARGCELFRSGSCDNDDDNDDDGDATPIIDCTALGAVTLYTRNEATCQVQDTWVHTLPTDNCDVIIYTYTIENPDGTIAGPFDISALLNPDITNPLPDQFIGEYDFQHQSPTQNVSTITYYAEDAVGNFTQCSFTVTVIDDDPPRFINCPEPAVIVDAPATWCSAFANYSLPLAVDNCGPVVVTQIDDTGLTSGSLFPVGITINTFEAVDETGNSITCDVKIIVNDFHTPPVFECPDNVEQQNDEGDCGAIVENIAPTGIVDNCPENLTVVYRIEDEAGMEVASGFDDASGNFFDLGTNTVSYSIQDMPLLLITEVTHEFSNTVDGAPATTPSCFDGIQNGDETDVDCGGSVCTSCNCTDNEVIINITLDGNPEETTWTITVPNDGAILAAGGPYAAGLAGTTITESICLPNDCYDFVIRDAGLNGISTGGGSYTVTSSDEELAAGGDFGNREVTNFCLSNAPPAGSLTGTAGSRDAIEITNFGSANLDVSCLMVERAFPGGSEFYAVPTGAILAPGGVLTIHYGDGHDDPANNVFYVPGTADLPINEPTAYILSLSRSVLDVAVMNGFDISGTLVPPAYELGSLTAADYWTGTISPIFGGGIVRTTVWDTDSATDFVPGEACLPLTIGTLNPGLAQPTPNGASTAIQAQPTVRVECDFTVTITDDEAAVCGLYSDYFDYSGGPINIEYGECVETVISVADVYNIADLNLNLAGPTGDLGNLTITLISPEGNAVELADAVCPGTNNVEFTFDGDFGPVITDACGILNNAGQLVMPVGDIESFNGEAVNGDWILQIGHNGQQSTVPATISSYILFISARDEYPDYTTTIGNDFRECGADFTWFHPILFDNCPGGTLEMTITFEDGDVETQQTLEIFPENTDITYFFRVGVTSVLYTLTDAAGNVSTCGFDITVEDRENPTLICPEDITIQLDGGECDVVYIPQRPEDWDTDDNCAVTQIIPSPDWNLPLPIGINEVMLTVRDAAGNDTTCTYIVTVLEYIPDNPQMACIAEVNVHLPPDCSQEIIPSMVLAGDEYYCFDNYEITLFQEDENGELVQLPSNIVGVDQIGATLTYMIYDPRNDDTCWGVVNVGFFSPPEFICPDNLTVSCNAETDTSMTGVPVLLSCALAGAEVSFADTLQRFEACDDPRAILRRTWLVEDTYGNSTSCVQTITFEAFDLDVVIFPEDLDGNINPAISCSAAANDPTLTDPENTGFPTVADGTNIFTNNFCSASYLYDDEVYNICAGSYEIVRTWKVRNTCQPLIEGINPREAVQIIRVLDQENPVIDLPDDVTVSTTGIGCEGFHVIAPPVVAESCSDYTYEVTVSGGTLEPVGDGSYVLVNLAPGSYTVQYEVEDECGRYGEGLYTVTVVDQVSPLASCEDGLNVSLDGSGYATISAEEVDKASADQCSEVSLEIRRVFTQNDACEALPDSTFSSWGQAVDFSCCDGGDMVTIELRVTDQNQNVATCWTQVLVEDKLIPTCLAPPAMSISCVDVNQQLPADISEASDEELNALFGTPSGIDNCSTVTVTQSISGSINNCGVGTFTRLFTVTDGVGLTNNTVCAQQISVYDVHDYTITLPTDEESTCGEIPPFEGLVSDNFACDLITTDVVIDTITSDNAPEACFTLRVTYDIINFCEYNQLGEAYLIPRGGDGIRDPKTQPLYLIVSKGDDESTIGDDFAFLSRFTDRIFNEGAPQFDQLVDDGDDNDGSDDDNDNDNEQDQAPDGIGFPYADDDSRGFFRYIQYVDVYDNDAPTISGDIPEECFAGTSEDCSADVTLTFTAEDGCSAPTITLELDMDYDHTTGFVADAATGITLSFSNDSINYTINASNVPVGSHAIRIRANDGCGNADLEIIEFCVTGDKAPTPICIQTVTVTLMPDGEGGGMGTIWASDMIASDVDDCFGNQIEDYSIYREAGFDDSDVTVFDTGLEFNCDDLGDVPVRVYAIADNGTNDYCSVIVEVQAFQAGMCDDDGGSLAGSIMTEEMNTVENVIVTLEGANDFTSTITTSDNGTFLFTGLVPGDDFTVTPTHFTDYLNGVRTSDIVGITQHILGIDRLASPYKFIAADVDGNAEINVGDIINIRRLIIGLSDAFPNDVPSWAFVPADFEFANLNDPWGEAFPAVINVNNLAGNVANANFVAIKIGDVNSSAIANLQQPAAPRNTFGELELELDEVEMRAGDTYTLPVTASTLNAVSGYQFTLEFDHTAISIDRIEDGLVEQGNFGWRFADRGIITTSWNWEGGAAPANWSAEEVLFTLIVRAETDVKLSDVIGVGSRYTEAEAYQMDSDVLQDIVLTFNTNLAAEADYQLFQNIPNPVSNSTLIGFELPVADAEVVIRITDAAGRLVREFRQEGVVGYNSLQITRDIFTHTSGVYSYTVSAGEWSATKRMIVIE